MNVCKCKQQYIDSIYLYVLLVEQYICCVPEPTMFCIVLFKILLLEPNSCTQTFGETCRHNEKNTLEQNAKT